MYGILHVASTPEGSSTVFNKEHRHSLSQCIFPRYACAFLDDNPSCKCCSTNSLPGSLSCRHSPRLLSNGYYVLTEDSFLSDEDGNITLTPSQTSVTYKENLVRVFRRRKKFRRNPDILFSLSASSSWISSNGLSNMDSSCVDHPWPDGCHKLEASQRDIESRRVRNFLSQLFALVMCLIISICTRYFLGGMSATLLLIILFLHLNFTILLSQDAAVSSSFSLDTSFKTTKF
ncbi:TMM71 protein, partial [Chloroceryle aenea]|nr:TMM71 protein [Chloroceryle aenea]